jgi:hypothetical protein
MEPLALMMMCEREEDSSTILRLKVFAFPSFICLGWSPSKELGLEASDMETDILR